jgi:hypothetical protein
VGNTRSEVGAFVEDSVEGSATCVRGREYVHMGPRAARHETARTTSHRQGTQHSRILKMIVLPGRLSVQKKAYKTSSPKDDEISGLCLRQHLGQELTQSTQVVGLRSHVPVARGYTETRHQWKNDE